jgi:uncharacterized membrane protein
MTFRRAISNSLSWRRVAIAEAYALILLARQWLGLDAQDRFGSYVIAETFSWMVAALLVLLAMGIAEEAVRRGARRILSYALAVIAASLVSALLFTLLWFDMAWRTERSVVLFVLEATMQMALWPSLALIVLDNRIQTARVRQGVKRAQMKRVRLERAVLQARLDAARKQIDGPMLFQELTEIRDSLRNEDPQAAETLERLVQRLRSIQAGTAQFQSFGGVP